MKFNLLTEQLNYRIVRFAVLFQCYLQFIVKNIIIIDTIDGNFRFTYAINIMKSKLNSPVEFVFLDVEKRFFSFLYDDSLYKF